MNNEKHKAVQSECEKYYRRLYTICGEILTKSFSADEKSSHSISHHYILDLEKWIDVLSSHSEVSMLKAALREYQFGLLNLVLGQYRQAFMALRLFLELGLGAVLFSANELDLRLWLQGSKDIIWHKLVATDNGVFSKAFVRAFFESLEDEAPQYQNIAEKLFRECSEYVHGNAYANDKLPDTLQFEKRVFLDWHEKAQSARIVVSFALCLRNMHFLDRTSLSILEPIIRDELGHVTAIRTFLNDTMEKD